MFNAIFKSNALAHRRMLLMASALIVGLIWLLGQIGSAKAQVETPIAPKPAEIPTAPVGTPLCGPTQNVSGTIDTNTTWAAGKVYVLTGDITVNQLTTLTIQPGAVIKINYDKGFTINGKLIANGSAQNPVYFTSIKDDSICGDTNGDSTASVPNTGDWRNIHFSEVADPESSITRVVVRYGGKNERGYDDDWYPPIVIYKVVPIFSNITFEDNYRNGIGILGSDWLTDEFRPSNVIHILYGDMRILQANTLTIPAGLIFKIEYDTGITIDGKFAAKGTKASPIIFTSIHDDSYCGIGAADELICDSNNDTTATVPNSGDWRNIHFSEVSDPTSEMSRVIVRYGGKNERGYNDDWYPPIVVYQSTPIIENISFEHNFRNGVGVLGSDWLSDGFESTTIIHILYGDMRILQANTFIFSAGVLIKPEYDKGITVEGKLTISGSADQPVIVTSINDDEVCGIGAMDEPVCDTNNDGVASVPTTGDWRWISFSANSDSTSTIDHAIVRYGGKNEAGYNDQWKGVVRLDSVSPHISYSAFVDNWTGIDLIGDAQPTLTCNDFEDNESPYGIYNDTLKTVDARNSWWGSVSGPTHATNPYGKGDEVTDGVDFTPWRTTPCILPPLPPEAAFEAVPTSGEAPLAVSFFNTSAGSVTSSQWAFGDGGISTQLNPTHTYMKPGVYTVTLTVNGPAGSDTITSNAYIMVDATVYRMFAPTIIRPR